MQAFLAALSKAIIMALPELLAALYNKVVKPAIESIGKKIEQSKQKRENKKKAKALKDAKTPDDIDAGFGNMP